MTEWRLFTTGTVPEFTTPGWYRGRPRGPHLEQPGHRERLHLTADFVLAQVVLRGVESVSDLGCGDGGLLSLIQHDVNCWGYDISPAAIAGANERGVRASLLDVMEAPDFGELSVVTEVLEHLVDPHAYVRRLARHSQFVVASSPYTENDRDHYEFHTWAWDYDGYEKLFRDAGFSIMRHETVQSFQVLAAEVAE